MSLSVGVLYEGERGLVRRVGKRWAYLSGGLYAGELIGGEIRYALAERLQTRAAHFPI